MSYISESEERDAFEVVSGTVPGMWVQAPYAFAMVMLAILPVPWGTDLPAHVADAGAAHCPRGRLSTRRHLGWEEKAAALSGLDLRKKVRLRKIKSSLHYVLRGELSNQ